MWVVFAVAPDNLISGWDFRAGHFPRRFALKKDAQIAEKEAKRKGAVFSTVVKETKEIKKLLTFDLKNYHLARCERCGNVFAAWPQYDDNGGRDIACHTCGRSYHNIGHESKPGWHADRPLTILHDPKDSSDT